MFRHIMYAFLLVGMMLGSFHYHDDIHESEECQVCIIEHNLASADPVDNTLYEFFNCPCEKIDERVESFISAFNPKHTLSRAPPSFS